MADRVVFTNPLTGRFVSAADAGDLEQVLRRVYSGGQMVEESVLEYGSPVQDSVSGGQENWRQEDGKWGASWISDDDQLSFSALQNTPFPEGYIGYRIRFTIAGNPSYPQGYASTDWLQPDQWPPDLSMAGDRGATGIAMIHFESPR